MFSERELKQTATSEIFRPFAVGAEPSGSRLSGQLFVLARAAEALTLRVMSWVLFFDGNCAFCSDSVRRVVRLDQQGRVSFAPLQGELAAKMGFSHHAAEQGGTMVLLRESDGKVFTHSDGWIELASALGGWWRFLTITRFIPKPLRDMVYRCVARNRYHFMGRADTCSLPDPEVLKRLRP
jgi:predicted DCC family thiol-disulfide oxidoreductase YuxK